MSARTLLVANPMSRGGATRRAVQRASDALRSAFGPHELVWTSSPGDAARRVAEAAHEVERVVVAGGDGTVGEVARGLLEAGAGARVELGLLPLGTGCDLARSLGVPHRLEAAIEWLARARAHPVDAGSAEFLTRSSGPQRRAFVNVASTGLSGEVTRLVNQGSKALGGRLAFLRGTLAALAGFQPFPARVLVDGREVFAGSLVLAVAANGRYFGGGMKVAPQAKLDDGLLDAVVIGGISKARVVSQLHHVYRGSHLALEGVSAHRGRCIEIEAEPAEGGAELDGEPIGARAARFQVLPAALRVLGELP